jgi:hypothetical protein
MQTSSRRALSSSGIEDAALASDSHYGSFVWTRSLLELGWEYEEDEDEEGDEDEEDDEEEGAE